MEKKKISLNYMQFFVPLNFLKRVKNYLCLHSEINCPCQRIKNNYNLLFILFNTIQKPY